MRALGIIAVTVLFSLILASCDVDRIGQPPTPEPVAEEPTPTPEPDPTPEPEPDPTPTPQPPHNLADEDWMERGRLTVLLAGSDEAPDREGERTDAMIVASIDLETDQAVLFGVPRNYADVPLPDEVVDALGMHEYPDMLKTLYGEARAHPELAPEGGDPGMAALKVTIQDLLDLHIDYYAMVNMAGFVELVDTFGGVDVNVREPIIVRLLSPFEEDEWHQFQLMPGQHTLDGMEALAFVRHRTGTTDYDRMERQRCLVTAIAEQADLQTLATVFPDMIGVIRDNVVTDIPLEILPEMMLLRDNIDPGRVVTIGFNPPDYLIGESSRGYNLPNINRIQRTVQDVLADPAQYQNESDLTDDTHC